MGGIMLALALYSVTVDFGINNAMFISVCDIIINILFWISAVLCIISGGIYLVACKDYINPSK
jgi:hypothetical protein